jgi:transcriptional regulator with XRE-family HTH domain
LEVAERLGCDRTTIGAYESGKIVPSLGMARKLAKLFGISLDELTADEPEDDALALETATAP